MREEIEFQYIVKLLNSNYLKKKRNQISGCKSDFERVCNAPKRMTEFYNWLNLLIKDGCLVFVGDFQTSKGKKVSHYVIDYDKLFERLKRNQLYSETYKVFEDKALFGIIED